MILGSTPALVFALIVTNGSIPNSSAFLRLITTNAAAPSLIPDALPAVTEPSFLNAGRNLPKPSAVVPNRGNSSWLTTVTCPLRPATSTGTISSAKQFDSITA
jgi:hypothetical protein